MMPDRSWHTASIIKATEGRLLTGSAERRFSGISIDSRKISDTDLFVAIQGENHDGHTFAPDIVEKGGRGLIISLENAPHFPLKAWEKAGAVCIGVENTLSALGALGRLIRQSAGIPLAAITGSNGKTTTRSLTAAIFSLRYSILTPQGNFNNEVGLPLTLFNLKPEHEWAIVELGMNAPGEIARLTKICQPDIGIITNIGPAHLLGLGSMNGVMRAKGELLKEMPADRTAILNADDPRTLALGQESPHRTLYFGFSEAAQIRGHSLTPAGNGLAFTIELPDGAVKARLNSPAEYFASNALAAAAAAAAAGIDGETVAQGIAAFRPVDRRMDLCETEGGFHLIDDTYNANPGSMKAAVEALARMKGKHRGILVMGDMLELGEHAESLHADIGAEAAALGIDRLYAAGTFAKHTADAAVRSGMAAKDAVVGTKEEILADVKTYLEPGDWVLVKGSRSMRMETVSDGIRNWKKQ